MKKSNNFKNSIVIFTLLLFLGNLNIANAYDSSAVDYYNQGTYQVKSGNYSQAIKLFKKSIEIDPTITDVYYNLGIAYEAVYDVDNAIKTFEVWIRTHPTDDDAIFHIAKLYYESDNYRKALFYANTIPSGSVKYSEAQALLNSVTQKLNTQKRESSTQTGNGIATFTDFEGPTGICEDSKGNLYIAQYTSNSIVKITYDNNRKILVKGKPLGGPIGLALDSKDNLYAANYLTGTIVKISPDGSISTVLKDLKQPYNVYVNSKSGYLFVTSQGDKSVSKYKI